MGWSASFIDGAYFAGVRRELGVRDQFVDFARVADGLSDGWPTLRTYFYDCLPWVSDHREPAEIELWERKRAFFQKLERLPRFQVRTGQLVFRGYDRRDEPIFQQKGVDILLGLDMVQLAASGRLERVALLAGDGDFVPAVEAAKRHGALVCLFHGSACPEALWEICDERVALDGRWLDAVR